jgi:hypothetical protein
VVSGLGAAVSIRVIRVIRTYGNSEMDKNERKEVRISEEFDPGMISLCTFGEEVFGSIAVKSFIADIYSRVWSFCSL